MSVLYATRGSRIVTSSLFIANKSTAPPTTSSASWTSWTPYGATWSIFFYAGPGTAHIEAARAHANINVLSGLCLPRGMLLG